MPTLRQLEYFSELAEQKHFRRAAEKSGVSQPTLSAQLIALEQRLGVQLFERSRSVVLLTPVGEKLLVVARRVLRDVQEIRDLAASERGEMRSTIRLGLSPTVGTFLLPRMLPELRERYPGCKFYVREQVSAPLQAALEQGAHDVIISPVPLASAELESAPIFREPLFVVAPSDHPLAKKGYVERSDLQGQPVLALETGHQLHEQVEALCDEFGAKLLFDYEGTSLGTLSHMTELGMGVSFLPALFVVSELSARDGVVALEFKGRSIHRTIGLAWRRTSARGLEYRSLADIIRETVARDFPICAILEPSDDEAEGGDV